MVMDVRSAELTKYAANAMLATRISFMNELALLAERVGADIEQVRQGHRQRSAHRLGFLYPAAAMAAVLPEGREGLKDRRRRRPHLQVLSAVEAANDRQKTVLVDKVVARFGDNLAGHHFAMWGLA